MPTYRDRPTGCWRTGGCTTSRARRSRRVPPSPPRAGWPSSSGWMARGSTPTGNGPGGSPPRRERGRRSDCSRPTVTPETNASWRRPDGGTTSWTAPWAIARRPGDWPSSTSRDVPARPSPTTRRSCSASSRRSRDAEGDERSAAPAAQLVRFLAGSQLASGELPYAVAEARGGRTHYQCVQYNAFEAIDLLEYHRATGDPNVEPIVTSLVAFVAAGADSHGRAFYDCRHGRRASCTTARHGPPRSHSRRSRAPRPRRPAPTGSGSLRRSRPARVRRGPLLATEGRQPALLGPRVRRVARPALLSAEPGHDPPPPADAAGRRAEQPDGASSGSPDADGAGGRSPRGLSVKVLVVTSMWPTPQAPASGTFVATQVRSLQAAGVEVDVCHLPRRKRASPGPRCPEVHVGRGAAATHGRVRRGRRPRALQLSGHPQPAAARRADSGDVPRR